MKQNIYRDLDTSGGTGFHPSHKNMHVDKDSSNYACSVVRIEKIFDIEGADKIQRVLVNGNDVVTSKEVKLGDIMLYFVAGTKLNEEYCKYNDLLTDETMNRNKVKGYISHKQFRVKAINLRGVISNGMLLPVSSLNAFDFYPKIKTALGTGLSVGEEFTHLFGVKICEKYIVPIIPTSTKSDSNKVTKVKLADILVDKQFRLHFETPHLVKNIHKLSYDSEIIITDKWHGSSCILAKIKTKRPLSIVDKISRFFGANICDTKYTGLFSSGKPKSGLPKGIEGHYENPNKSFYSQNIWRDAFEKYKFAIEEGISIYSELVGVGIQKGYDYGTINEPRMVVYRITRTNDIGHVDEFSWNQVEEYCTKYGLETVKVLFKGKLSEWLAKYPYGGITNLGHTKEIDKEDFIAALSHYYLEKKCAHCLNSVWAEGICMRVENPFEIFKLKSKNFILSEDKELDSGVFVES